MTPRIDPFDAVAHVSGVNVKTARAVLLGEATDSNGVPIGKNARVRVVGGLTLLGAWKDWPATTAMRRSRGG